MRACTWLGVALALVASCKKGGDAAKPLDSGELASLTGLMKTLEAVADGDADRRVAFLAAGFGEATGKKCFEELAEADTAQHMTILVTKCDVLCAKAKEELPKMEGGSKWAKAAELCGPERYGLKPGQEYLASLELAVVAEVAAWYVPMRKRLPDDHALAPVLDEKAAKAWFVLPVPSRGPVQLARTAAKETGGQRSPYYAVVTADKVSGGHAPRVRLSKAGIEWRDPDKLFPGTAGPFGDLVTLSARAAEARRNGMDIEDMAEEPQKKAEAKPEEKKAPEPAPEPEKKTEAPDDDEDDDESGGTGTKMALDEGKMGKKEPGRAEGQYKMRNNNTDPQLARQRRIEEAQKSGVLGTMTEPKGGTFASITGTGDISSGLDDRDVQGGLLGAELQIDVYEPEAAPLVLADASLPASRLWTVLGGAQGAWVHLAVDAGGVAVPHALPLGIERTDGTIGNELGEATVELRVILADERFLLSVSIGDTREVKSLEDLAAAYAELRKESPFTNVHDVVILVEGDKRTVGDLVAVLDLLHAGGARRAVARTALGAIGTGRYGTVGQGSGTGSGYGVGSGGMRSGSASVPQTRIGTATATGELDKNIIRRYIRQKLPHIEYCYQKQLIVNPKLAGTITVSFVIAGSGKVSSANAEGFDENVASCVAGVVKSIQFPKPKGGGSVTVSYPFTFKPGEE
jgi:hypothetical protein